MATDSSDQINLNPTTTTEENPKQTLDDDTTTTAVTPPDRLEEEEEEEEPTDEASDQPSVTAINSNAKYDEDSKSTVAAACSRGCCWCGSGFQYSEEDPPCQAIWRFFATDRGGEA